MPLTSQAPESRPLAQQVVRGGLWVAASSYFNIAFGFLAVLVLTRLLTPEEFGVFALASFFFALVNLHPKLGLGYAFTQRREMDGRLIGTYVTLEVAAGIGSILLGLAAAPVLHLLGYSADTIWVMLALAGVGLLESAMSAAMVLLDKELRFGYTSLVSSVAFPLSYIPAFWLALHGGGYWSLVSQSGTYALLLLVGMWWMTRRHLAHVWQLRWQFDGRTGAALVHFGVMVGAAGLAGVLVSQFDNFLVGTFVSLAVLGFYDRAYRVAQWPTLLITGVISRTTFYTYARLQDDVGRLQRTVTMSLWLITTLALPLAIGIFVAAPDLVALLYGERWLPSALFLRFLVAYSVIRPLLDDASALFVAVGKPTRSVAVSVVMAVTLMVVGTPFTLLWGAVGTSVAVGITFLVGLGITYRYVIQTIVLKFAKTLGLPLLATAVTLLLYWLLLRSFDVNSWPLIVRVAAKGIAAPVTYLAIMFALEGREMWERALYVYRLLRPGRSVPSAPIS
jgi:lipopolysaccharide exporter